MCEHFASNGCTYGLRSRMTEQESVAQKKLELEQKERAALFHPSPKAMKSIANSGRRQPSAGKMNTSTRGRKAILSGVPEPSCSALTVGRMHCRTIKFSNFLQIGPAIFLR